MAGSSAAPVPEQASGSGSGSKRTALEAAASAPLPAPGGSSSDAPAPNTISGVIYGVQLAHYDYAMWFYKPHGSVYDAQMSAVVDANNIKREFVGYGLIGLIVLLLCTSLAPLVANLISIVYPLVATFAILRSPENTVESTRFLTYWAFFAVLSIFDYKFGAVSTLYWLIKILVCVYLYLPQTQGAVVVYAAAIRPLLDFIDANIAPKFA